MVPGPWLSIELSPRGWVPVSGSTSSLFIQDLSGNRHLRLDHGFNKATNQVDIHFNQKGTFSRFGIVNHTPAGQGARLLYHGARVLRVVGRPVFVISVATQGVSVATAENKPRALAREAGGLAGALAGAKVGGVTSVVVFSPSGPVGAAAAGLGGAITGGTLGYFGGWRCPPSSWTSRGGGLLMGEILRDPSVLLGLGVERIESGDEPRHAAVAA